MAEWLFEAGIGEARAVLIDDGAIIEAAIEPDDGGPRAGAIVLARLTRQIVTGQRGIAAFAGGEAMLSPLPRGLSEGGSLLIEIVREPIAEPGHPKRAVARPADPDAAPADGPDLAARIAASGVAVRMPPIHGPDLFERAGWSELLDEAASGAIVFDGGALRLSLTPAMTLFDVDGILPPPALALAGARAAAQAIRRMGIAGSIGIDLPTVGDRATRAAAAGMVDEILPQPFERTAVNGFGFIQIIRRRTRASLAEQIQHDKAGAAARALLRLAERTPGAGPRTLIAAPPVIARIAARQDWLDRLTRGIGAPVDLRPEPSLAISAGHVHAEPLPR